METEHYEFKTITFKNGKTLEITEKHFEDICQYFKKNGLSGSTTLLKDNKPIQVLNLEEIAFIS